MISGKTVGMPACYFPDGARVASVDDDDKVVREGTRIGCKENPHRLVMRWDGDEEDQVFVGGEVCPTLSATIEVDDDYHLSIGGIDVGQVQGGEDVEDARAEDFYMQWLSEKHPAAFRAAILAAMLRGLL